MKSSIKKSTYKAIYRLLNTVSPIEGNCGYLCGSACCLADPVTSFNEDDFQMGIYLLPGEDKLFTKKEDWLHWSYEYAEDYYYPSSWHGKVYFIRCLTPPNCHREMRPLQCRTYPLSPHINFKGELSMILSSSETPYTCPLISEEIPLSPKFVKATYTVWKRLIKDPLIYDLVLMDSKEREFLKKVPPGGKSPFYIDTKA